MDGAGGEEVRQRSRGQKAACSGGVGVKGLTPTPQWSPSQRRELAQGPANRLSVCAGGPSFLHLSSKTTSYSEGRVGAAGLHLIPPSPHTPAAQEPQATPPSSGSCPASLPRPKSQLLPPFSSLPGSLHPPHSRLLSNQRLTVSSWASFLGRTPELE